MREIAKAFSKTVSGTALSLLISTISVKIIAMLIGPSGMGLYGILRQIQSTTLVVATMGGQTALVQGGSSKEGEDRQTYLQTVFVLFLVSGLLAAGALIALAPFLKRQDATAVNLIRLLALPVFLTVLTSYGMGVLNIHRALGYMASIQVVAAVVTLGLSYPTALAVQNGWEVALVGIMSVTQAASLCLLIWWLVQQQALRGLVGNIRANFDKQAAQYFFSFAGVTILTSLMNSLLVLVLRGAIVQKYELATVGIFDAAWTLCVTYLSLLTNSFGTFYLPKLSSLRSKQEIRDLMQRTLLLATVISPLFIIAMIILKRQIILMLFSPEFLPSLSLLRWLLIADYFKMLSFVLAHPMLAFNHLKLFFWSELIWTVGLLAGSYYSIVMSNNLDGIGISVVVCYATYLVFTFWFGWKKYDFLPTKSTLLFSLLGLSLILGTSYFTF
jgi:O-antigen/teichoic acid export membrane protein